MAAARSHSGTIHFLYIPSPPQKNLYLYYKYNHKNYDLTSKENRKNLTWVIKREVTARVKNMPEGSTQRIVLDVRGRNYDKKLLDGVVKGIKNSCSDVYSDIPVDIMYQ
mgnify:CR=1 FL=1